VRCENLKCNLADALTDVETTLHCSNSPGIYHHHQLQVPSRIPETIKYLLHVSTIKKTSPLISTKTWLGENESKYTSEICLVLSQSVSSVADNHKGLPSTGASSSRY